MTSSVAEESSRDVSSRRNSARDAEVIAAYADDERSESMEAIGRRFGITRQRVQQIVWRWEAETGRTLSRLIQSRSDRPSALTIKSLDATLAQCLLSLARREPGTGCWTWTGRRYRLSPGREYPVLSIRGKPHYARRLAYTLWRDPSIPKDHFVVPMACRRMDCVNPFHLEAVPRREAFRAFPKQRAEKRPPRTHCLRGHEFTADNTSWNPCWTEENGVRTRGYTRLCKTCLRERHRSYGTKYQARMPPLPVDEDERHAERIVRRVTRAVVPLRFARLRAALDDLGASLPVHPRARREESWERFEQRTGATFGQWCFSRVLHDPRTIRALLSDPGRGSRS